MNGYLVLLRGSSDDYPVGLYASRQEAIDACQEVLAAPRDFQERLEKLGMAHSGSLSHVSIVSFYEGLPDAIEEPVDFKLESIEDLISRHKSEFE